MKQLRIFCFEKCSWCCKKCRAAIIYCSSSVSRFAVRRFRCKSKAKRVPLLFQLRMLNNFAICSLWGCPPVNTWQRTAQLASRNSGFYVLNEETSYNIFPSLCRYMEAASTHQLSIWQSDRVPTECLNKQECSESWPELRYASERVAKMEKTGSREFRVGR